MTMAVLSSCGKAFLQDGSSNGIYARTFASDGTPTSGEIAVNVTTLGNQRSPVVAALADGGFAVAWSGRGEGDANGTFARVFDGAGAAVTGEVLVNETTAFAQVYASIAADDDGGFAVAWHGNGGSDRKNVLFRHFDGTGSPLSSEVVVNETLVGIQKTPSITWSTGSELGGHFIVAWSGNGVEPLLASGVEEGADDDGIYARRIDGDGTHLGGEILVNSKIADKQSNPSIIGTEEGGFAVAWVDQSSPAPGANFEIAFREFTGDDLPLGDDVIVNTTLPTRQWSPTVSYRPGAFDAALEGEVVSDFIVTWSGRGIGDTFGVFTSFVTPEGPHPGSQCGFVRVRRR